jgi:hypothetical protein
MTRESDKDAEDPLQSGQTQPKVETDADAETRVLTDEDPTLLATRRPLPDEGEGSESPPETRVLDPGDSSLGVSESTDGDAETRVIGQPDDKTSPPPVSPGRGPSVRPTPTPIDRERGLVPGTVLFGEYEIVNVLGVGGMGEVYRARHRRLDEHRAI